MTTTKNTRFGIKEIFAIIFGTIFFIAVIVGLYGIKFNFDGLSYTLATLSNLGGARPWWASAAYYMGIFGLLLVCIFAVFEILGLLLSLVFKKNKFVKLNLRIANFTGGAAFVLVLLYLIFLMVGAIMNIGSGNVANFAIAWVITFAITALPCAFVTLANEKMLRASKNHVTKTTTK
ncbi:hypothetical protein [Mesoplasma seiffertii]|uniref:hypothetical protein n=1 Tax=Mesoplasma seiffertii TaxID=28224 RepID=UPI00047E39E2|nr:hypothetical protein [Mesoplasma seiffertii]